jgi:GH35 family endo-1,4-beta-xylanase
MLCIILIYFIDDGSYRKSFLYNGLGAGFIETSFRTARDVKDRAKLYYVRPLQSIYMHWI